MFSQSSLITEAQINVPVHFSFIQMTGHQLMLQTVKFSRRASWLWAHPPSAPPSARYSCYQLAGLFTWPRVTDSQPHVWSLETDKASTSTYLTQDFMTPSMFLSSVCVCGVCLCVTVVITPVPNTGRGRHSMFTRAWIKAPSVCSQSADLTFGHTLTACRL